MPARVHTSAPTAPESTWTEHNRAAGAARQRGDWADYRRQLERVRATIGDHPTLLVGVARASARLGEADSAMAALRRYASMGLALDTDGPDADSAWIPLHARADWAPLAARLRPRATPGRATVAFALGDSTAMAEGVAHDARTARTFVASIRRGTVTVRDGMGQRVFVHAPSEGDWWSLLGLAVDVKRGLLWASTAALPHFAARAAADSNRTALVAFDLFTGAARGRVELAPDGRRHVLGDISLLDDGTVIAADAEGGMLYALEPRGTALRPLVAAGVLPSPQGSAGARDRHQLFVADYVKGIVVVDRRKGTVRPLARPDSLALVGIDGLVRVGDELIAVQNGTRPQRVLRLTLDPLQTRVVKWEVLAAGAPTLDEPTHVAPFGPGQVLVVANSGWNRFTDEGLRRPDLALEPSRVLRIPLP